MKKAMKTYASGRAKPAFQFALYGAEAEEIRDFVRSRTDMTELLRKFLLSWVARQKGLEAVGRGKK